MNESQNKMVKLSGVMSGGIMRARVTSGSFSSNFGEIKCKLSSLLRYLNNSHIDGWNFIALGIDTNKLYWKICNGYT